MYVKFNDLQFLDRKSEYANGFLETSIILWFYIQLGAKNLFWCFLLNCRFFI